MKSKLLFVLSALVFISVTGCATKGIHPQAVFDDYHKNNSIGQYKCANGIAEKSCFRYAYDDYMNKGDIEKATIERNHHIENLINGIDVYYYYKRGALINGEAGVETATDIATYLSSATATLIKDTDVKSMLAALTGVIVAGKSSFDKNFLLSNSAHAIALKMDALRSSKYADIMKKKNEFSANQYSLDEAIKDIYEYYIDSTIVGAALSIAKDAGIEKKAAEDKQSKNIQDKETENKAKEALYQKCIDGKITGAATDKNVVSSCKQAIYDKDVK